MKAALYEAPASSEGSNSEDSATYFARISQRYQLTVPQEIVAEFGLKIGDYLAFQLAKDGSIALLPMRLQPLSRGIGKLIKQRTNEMIRRTKKPKEEE